MGDYQKQPEPVEKPNPPTDERNVNIADPKEINNPGSGMHIDQGIYSGGGSQTDKD